MDGVNIKSIEKKENGIELRLSFAKDADFFDGHFDDLAILPGVAQIDFAMKFAVKQLGIDPKIEKMTSLKFSNIIAPEKEIALELIYVATKKQVQFKYFDDTCKFSSGIFFLK